jgi:hypothetical protein
MHRVARSATLLLIAATLSAPGCKSKSKGDAGAVDGSDPSGAGPETSGDTKAVVEGYLEAMKAGRLDASLEQIMETDTEAWKEDADVVRMVKAQLASTSHRWLSSDLQVEADGRSGSLGLEIKGHDMLQVLAAAEASMESPDTASRAELADAVLAVLGGDSAPMTTYELRVRMQKMAGSWLIVVDRALMEALTGGLSETYLMRAEDE